jgi:hypothetical protein
LKLALAFSLAGIGKSPEMAAEVSFEMGTLRGGQYIIEVLYAWQEEGSREWGRSLIRQVRA